MTRIVPAGEIGRALGLTHVLRLPAPRGCWSWRPDEGTLVPPEDSPAPDFDRIRADAEALPAMALLVGPVAPEIEGEIDRIATAFESAGHVVAVFGGERIRTGRLHFADAFPNLEARGPALRPVFHGAPDGSEEDRYVPLRLAAEDGRKLVRWAEQMGLPDVDALLGAVFHGDDSPGGTPARWPVPIPLPQRFPTLALAVGSKLRSEGWRLLAAGEEVAAQELFGSARRIESLGERFDRYVETGLLRQLPGIDPRALPIVLAAL